MTATEVRATGLGLGAEGDVTAASIPATLALTGLTVVTAVGMGRLFDSTRYLLPLVAIAVVVHAFAWFARLRGVPIALATSAGGGLILLTVAWTVLPQTTAFGIPWRGTLSAFTTELGAAARDFGTALAPAPVTTGFLVASMLGIAIVAWTSDWAAFRVGSTFEGAIPALGLFVFTSVLGHAQHRWISVAAEVAAVAAYLALHSANSRARSTPWFASRAHGGQGTLLQGATLLGVVAVLSSVVIGPRLPGAEAEPIFAVRDRGNDGPSKRTTISPLVDIRGRLVDRSNVEAFTVASSARAYWRLTALDTFDGTIWSSNDSYGRAGGSLPSDPVGAAPGPALIESDFAIADLASIWLPAAFRAVGVSGVEGVSFNRDTGSLISRETTSDGLSYHVTSEQPRLTADQLADANAPPGEDMARYLTLPTTISPRVVALANDIAITAGPPFERARVLQDFFRGGNFTYDLGVDQGHDGRALENFLFSTRRGYCEQFAGSYAVLARLLGLPSRVAVGFTPGEVGEDGRFHVLGLHAHAWPEVHLPGYGWVAFEPTPGRGIPAAEAYTGVPESQASVSGATPTTLPSTTTTAAGGAGGATTTTTAAPSTSRPEPGARRTPIVRWLVVVALGLAAVVTTWIIGAPVARRARRARRRAAARTTAERVLVAWQEADEALGLAGVRRRPSETLTEHARRARARIPDPAASSMDRLAEGATLASYADEVPRDLAQVATDAAALVEGAVVAGASRGQRLRRELSLRD